MNNKGFTLVELVCAVIILFAILGEVMCIVKCINSDWSHRINVKLYMVRQLLQVLVVSLDILMCLT